jgi:hypothetical protein
MKVIYSLTLVWKIKGFNYLVGLRIGMRRVSGWIKNNQKAFVAKLGSVRRVFKRQ